MPEPKLKFALIGCGYIGKRYIQLLEQHPGCELVALIDTDSNRLSEFKNSNIPVFLSTETYFTSGVHADAAIAATPNGTHAAIAISCLKQNKHVLIEKPMALSKADAEAIIETAKEQDKKAMVVLQNRYSPVSVWLKEMIASKKLGAIFFIQVNCFWNRDERYYKKDSWHGTKEMDGGSLFTQFSHFVDTIYWLFGNVKNISSRFHNFNHTALTGFEDTGAIHFELEQGGMGCMNFTTATWDKSFESSLTVIAKKGTIKVSGQYMDRIEYCHVKDYEPPVEINKATAPANHHAKMVDAFVEAVKTGGDTNAKEALYSIDIIERMYAGSHS